MLGPNERFKGANLFENRQAGLVVSREGL